MALNRNELKELMLAVAKADKNAPAAYSFGDKLVIGTTGILEYSAAPGAGMVWQVAKVYTMADGQPAVKIQRIA